MTEKPIIGVLGLQGAVELHRPHIEEAGGVFRLVKKEEHFDGLDGLILPGGESTTMLKLIDRLALEDSIRNVFKTIPVWGICAGAILMAESVGNPVQRSFAALPITMIRNGYGRQVDSIHFDIDGYPVSFIRAPIIAAVHHDIDVMAKRDNAPIWVKMGKHMATTFHPELTKDYPSPMHTEFLAMVREAM